MKPTIQHLIFFICMAFGYSQNNSPYLTKNTNIYGLIDGNNLQQLISMDEMLEYGFMQEFMKEAFDKPHPSSQDVVLDFSRNSHFMIETKDDNSAAMVVLPILDAKTFGAILSKDTDNKIKSKKGLQYVNHNDGFVSWDNENAYIIFANLDTNDTPIKASNLLKKAITLKASSKIQKSAVRNTLLDENKNSSAPFKLWIKDLGSLPQYKELTSNELLLTNPFLKGMLNVETYMEMDFSKEDVEVNTISKLDPATEKGYADIYSRKIPEKYAQYVDTNTLLYYSLGVNTKAIFELFPEIVEALEKEKEENPMLGMFNAEMISELIKGDMMLVVNEVKPVEGKKIPETKASLVFSSDKIDFIEGMISNFGMSSGYMTKEEGYYSIKEPESGLEMGLRMENGMVLLSTNMEQIKLGDQYQPASLSKVHQDLLSGQNNAAIYVDTKQMMGIVQAFAPSETKELDFLNAFHHIKSKSHMEGNKIITSGTIHMNGTGKNTLVQFFDLIENLYQRDKDKEKL